jgi:hypothetical protein
MILIYPLKFQKSQFYVVSLALATFGLAASNVYAFDVAVGAKVSTLGVGVDLTPLLQKH